MSATMEEQEKEREEEKERMEIRECLYLSICPCMSVRQTDRQTEVFDRDIERKVFKKFKRERKVFKKFKIHQKVIEEFKKNTNNIITEKVRKIKINVLE